MINARSLIAAAALLLAPLVATAARKLAPEADAALTKAEQLLGKSTGDDRLVACIDAMPSLEIVTRLEPDYAYAVGLEAECHFLTEAWEPARQLLTRYIRLVPVAARKGPVGEKIERAQLRLAQAIIKLGKTPGEAAAEIAAIDAEVARFTDVPPPPPPEPAPPPKAPIAAAPPPAPPAAIPAPVAKPAPPVVAAPKPSPKPPEPAPKAAAKPAEVKPAPAPIALKTPSNQPPALTPEAPSVRQFALRAGLGMQAGGVGLGAEVRFGIVAISLGTGGYPITGGLSFSSGSGTGGLYLDLSGAWVGPSLLADRTRASHALVAGTIGWDFRPVKQLSIKAGVGGGFEAASALEAGSVLKDDAEPPKGAVFIYELTAGPVFDF